MKISDAMYDALNGSPAEIRADFEIMGLMEEEMAPLRTLIEAITEELTNDELAVASSADDA